MWLFKLCERLFGSSRPEPLDQDEVDQRLEADPGIPIERINMVRAMQFVIDAPRGYEEADFPIVRAQLVLYTGADTKPYLRTIGKNIARFAAPREHADQVELMAFLMLIAFNAADEAGSHKRIHRAAQVARKMSFAPEQMDACVRYHLHSSESARFFENAPVDSQEGEMWRDIAEMFKIEIKRSES